MWNLSIIAKHNSMSPSKLGSIMPIMRSLNYFEPSHKKKYNLSTLHYMNQNPHSSLDACIDGLAQEIDKSLKVTFDEHRKDRISSLFHTFLSLAPQINKPKIDNLDEQSKYFMDNETQGSTESALANLCAVSSGVNKAFSSIVKRITSSVLEHEMLTDGSVAEENLNCILKNSLHGNLGFGLKTSSKLLYYYPEIFQIDPATVEKRIQNLRKHHLSEGFLQRVISFTPKYLTLSQGKLNKIVEFITTNLDFKTSELPQLFLFSPQIFFDSTDVTEDKFHYIYFTMGYKKHYTLARHGVLRYNIQHLRNRHLFLERRGQYQLADKERKTTFDNPKIKGILCSSDAKFCREVAMCSLREYLLFRSVLESEDALRLADESEQDEEDNKAKEFADKLLQQMS